MANAHANKVIINGVTKIDLTADTVDAEHLLQGYTAHDKSGAEITGTASASNVRTYSGSFTTNTRGEATVNCGFVPDLVTIRTRTETADKFYYYIGCPLFQRANNNESIISTGWEHNAVSGSEYTFLTAVMGYAANGFEVYMFRDYGTTVSRQRFNFTAVKWTE